MLTECYIQSSCYTQTIRNRSSRWFGRTD